jgi:hypothetical protein
VFCSLLNTLAQETTSPRRFKFGLFDEKQLTGSNQ